MNKTKNILVEFFQSFHSRKLAKGLSKYLTGDCLFHVNFVQGQQLL